MDKPTSLRIPAPLRARLQKASAKANVPASDILLLGLQRFLDEHRSTDAIIEAVITHRKAQAAAAS